MKEPVDYYLVLNLITKEIIRFKIKPNIFYEDYKKAHKMIITSIKVLVLSDGILEITPDRYNVLETHYINTKFIVSWKIEENKSLNKKDYILELE